MRRELIWGDAASAEFEAACGRFAQLSVQKGVAFVEAVDGALESLADFPAQGTPLETALDEVARRLFLRPFGFHLTYTVYPSVDFQTGEALDVIHVLACRHERQGEPNWEARDPFRL